LACVIRIVDHRIDQPDLRLGRVEHGDHLRLVRHVALHRERLVRPNRFHEIVQPLFPTRRNDHLRALGRQHLGKPLAQPARRPRHQRHTSRNTTGHHSLLQKPAHIPQQVFHPRQPRRRIDPRPAQAPASCQAAA